MCVCVFVCVCVCVLVFVCVYVCGDKGTGLGYLLSHTCLEQGKALEHLHVQSPGSSE